MVFKFCLRFYNVTRLANVAMFFSFPFCHIQTCYEIHLQSSFSSAFWVHSFPAKPRDGGWLPAKGRKIVFKAFKAFEFSYPFAEESNTDRCWRESGGTMGEWSELVLQIPCSYFYVERYHFQYGTCMIQFLSLSIDRSCTDPFKPLPCLSHLLNYECSYFTFNLPRELPCETKPSLKKGGFRAKIPTRAVW